MDTNEKTSATAPAGATEQSFDDRQVRGDGERASADQGAAAPVGDVEQLRAELEAERARAEERLGDLKRVQADFINFKRRAESEQTEKAKFANAMLILKILPILDDLERALDSAGPSLSGLQWVQGVDLIARKMRTTLESEGLQKIEALGQEFDPRLHEAVLHEEGEPGQEGKVVGVLQTGYKLNDRVIRPAMVKVAKGA